MKPTNQKSWKSYIPFLRARTWLVLRVWEIRAYVSLALHGENKAAPRILIFGQGRSGTTLLEDLICNSGYASGHGEILHHHTREVWFPEKFVKGLARLYPAKGIVLHVKGSQLTSTRTRPIDRVEFLRAMSNDGWLIIHVVRESSFDQVHSEFAAKARGSYHKTDSKPETKEIAVEPGLFLNYYNRVEEYKSLDAEALSSIPHIRITYENDLMPQERHQLTVDRIFDALGLPRRTVTSQLKKIARGSAKGRLSNYNDVVSELRNAGWSESFE